MPLPTGFPTPPKRPPANQPVLNSDGTFTQAWLAYLDATERYQALVRKHLDTL